MKKITLITGGHGSGKTAQALRLASSYPKKIYIATAEPLDEEMQQKITLHKAERDDTYHTLEAPVNLADALKSADILSESTGLIIVDCLTVWLGNLFHYETDAGIHMDNVLESLETLSSDVIFITNESSLSLIPPDSLSRRYLKALSGMNKKLASRADTVYLMISGIPLTIKGVVNDD